MAGAVSAYQKLYANWGRADPDLEALPEVRSGAGLICGNDC